MEKFFGQVQILELLLLLVRLQGACFRGLRIEQSNAIKLNGIAVIYSRTLVLNLLDGNPEASEITVWFVFFRHDFIHHIRFASIGIPDIRD